MSETAQSSSFDRLVHADWSVTPGKRWMAVANRSQSGWSVQKPKLVRSSTNLLDEAFQVASEGKRQLIGFDFPIGVPKAYGDLTKLGSFRRLLNEIGTGIWSDFFNVSAGPAQVHPGRPFYPSASTKGVSRAELVAGLGVSSFKDLLRICERRTSHRREACSLFWTLGGNQVGKGALSGWREIIKPALLRGALLWPFDGTLPVLSEAASVVLAETYPAEAYRMVDASFSTNESKRRQVDRRSKSTAILAWTNRSNVVLSGDTSQAVANGFGSHSTGEDQFDALLGLLKMIEVCDGRRPERTEQSLDTDAWEGWILGR